MITRVNRITQASVVTHGTVLTTETGAIISPTNEEDFCCVYILCRAKGDSSYS